MNAYAVPMTKLKKFVAKRNKSSFHSNFQFGIDADACGIRDVTYLGTPKKFTIDGHVGWEWQVPIPNDKTVRMIEFGRTLYLESDYDYETTSMFKLMAKAKYETLE